MEQVKNGLTQWSNPSEMLSSWLPKQSLSVETAINQPQISALRKLNEQTTREKIILILSRCVQMCGVERTMNAMQIDFTAEMIVREYWMYSLEDIQLCTERGVSGLYGELYNRLDTSVVFGWLKKYEAERMIEIARKRQQEVERHNIYDVFQNDTMRGVLHDVVDKMKLKEVETEKQPEPERKLSPFEQMVLDEWDGLKISATGAFKEYNNVYYDFTDYRKKRFEELNTNENG